MVFLQRPRSLISRNLWLELTQDRAAGSSDRSIDILVSRLRRKLHEAGVVTMLRTMRRKGYLLAVAVEVRN
ncbi:winged helix-turn-helix domain-containing protein [Agrobacterium sp. CG160-95]|uniref:winged helix-turn-helix domain-containing protein n=1 Tax=Agrobacterium TaxID=357 RepID=UPI001297B94E|nr:winged helix-turn-helix domain-containing protein [Agrobacterium sp. ICMP 6402]